eukprot:scaffold139539_cov24-Prasinocladus_malaysianus.AAC.1
MILLFTDNNSKSSMQKLKHCKTVLKPSRPWELTPALAHRHGVNRLVLKSYHVSRDGASRQAGSCPSSPVGLPWQAMLTSLARKAAGATTGTVASAYHGSGYNSDEEVYATAKAIDKGVDVEYDDDDNPIVVRLVQPPANSLGPLSNSHEQLSWFPHLEILVLPNPFCPSSGKPQLPINYDLLVVRAKNLDIFPSTFGQILRALLCLTFYGRKEWGKRQQ